MQQQQRIQSSQRNQYNKMDQPNHNDERDAVVTVTVGEGPKALVDRAQTLRFVFHDFEGMKQECGERVDTPRLEAFGYWWGLGLYPKGDSQTDIGTEYSSVFLVYIGDDKYAPSAECTFRCKEHERRVATTLFRNNRGHGVNFLSREDVIENCLEDDGSLIIEVDLKITLDSKLVWYPKIIHEEKSLKQSYLEASSSSNNPTEEESENNDTTDVVFVVDNDEFPAHKLVLSLHAKTLFALYKEHVGSNKTRKRNVTTRDDNGNDDDDEDDRARVHIFDINSDTFKKCIEFIYTVNTTPNLVDAAAAIELMLAAHQFECVSLKLYVESVLVDKFVTPTNAASMLLLGDTYHCALLKEAALHSYISDPISFRESEDPTTATAWSKVQESSRLLTELLVNTDNKVLANRNPTSVAIQESAGETSGTARTGTTTNTDAVVMNTMDVGTLREHLEEANLGLDGSREMLVTRLRNYRQTTVTRV